MSGIPPPWLLPGLKISATEERHDPDINLNGLRQQLAAREAELTILNSIQAALAGNEDLDAIFEMVGGQISELFPGHAIALFTYDAASDLARPRFLLEEGVRIESPPVTPGPIGRHLKSSRKSLMVSTASAFEELGAIVLEGTQPSLSGLYAPMIVNGEMVGTIHVDGADPYDDVTLLVVHRDL